MMNLSPSEKRRLHPIRSKNVMIRSKLIPASLQKTTIKVSKKTLKELKDLKKHPRETMESVIKRLIARYRGEPEPPIEIH